MISCSCIVSEPYAFKIDALQLAGVIVDHCLLNRPANCLQGNIYTVAYAAGSVMMAWMAKAGHFTSPADINEFLEVFNLAVTEGTAQWNADKPDRALHASAP